MSCAKKFGNYARVFATFALACSLAFVLPGLALASDDAGENNSTRVLQAFDKQQAERTDAGTALSEKKKHLIMFSIGVPLLVLLLITGALGIAMGVFGKPVFLLHMIFAGLTMTLALVHVIVGLVWFYPF